MPLPPPEASPTAVAMCLAGIGLLVIGGWAAKDEIARARDLDKLVASMVVYGPVLIVALSEPGTAVEVEGINYFADTLLFAGAFLTMARAAPRSGATGLAGQR